MKTKVLVMVCLGIFLFLILITSVNASQLPAVYYLDMDCYHDMCKNNSLLFDTEQERCTFEPILSEDTPLPQETNAKNKEEYFMLDNNSKKIIRQIYRECTKVNSTATNELRGEILRKRDINLMKGLFRAFLYLILPIVTIIWLISWFGDRIGNKKIRRKKGKHKLFFLIIFFIFVFPTIVYGITDPSLGNNNMAVNIDVIDTRDLRLVYENIALSQADDNIFDFVSDNDDFIESVYPLSDVGLQSSIFKNYPEELIPSEVYQNDFETGGAFVLLDFYNLIFKRASVGGKPDRVIGIVEPGYFAEHFPFLQASGFALPNTYTAVVEYGVDFALAGHELGHLYLLCDEYNDNDWFGQNVLFSAVYGFECPNGDVNDDGLLDANCNPGIDSGCPTSTLDVVRSPTDNLLNFMGFTTTYSEKWVAKDTYIHLLNAFDKSQPNYLPNLKPKDSVEFALALIATGLFYKNGTASIDTAYIIENVTVINNTGSQNLSYVLHLINDQGDDLFNISFDSTFQIYGDNGTTVNLTVAPFQFILPWNESIDKIKIVYNGTISTELDVSANTPQISLATIDNSSLISEPFNLIWNASDADGDILHYAILASPDGGSNYTTLEVDYNQTSYEVDPNDFTYSEQYLFKVLVTDGINTNNDISNTFTMGVHPSDLFINVKTLNDTYNDVNGTDTVTLDYITISPQYSSIFKFSNNLSTENITFTAGQSITRYLRLPKYINVTSAKFNISGRGVQE